MVLIIQLETNPQKEADPITLSSLLNVLDGTLETPGRIIIMTSNFPEKLDKALIRPGRIDVNIEFTKCTEQMMVDMYENFYEQPFPSDYRKLLIDYVYTPAEFIAAGEAAPRSWRDHVGM